MQFPRLFGAKSGHPERRRSRRKLIPIFEAVYWNGASAVRRRVQDISVDGAAIETPDRWYPGTMMQVQMVVHHHPDNGAESREAAISEPVASSFPLYAKVVRHLDEGMCVAFVFQSDKERRAFSRLVSAVERLLEGEANEVKSTIRTRTVTS